MNITKMLLGTLIGGVALFLSGWLIWGFLLAGLQDGHRTSVEGIYKTEPDVLLIFISCLAGGALLTLIFNRWAGIQTWATGAKAGAMIMLLYGLMADLAVMAEFTIIDSTFVLLNIGGNIIWGAIGGAVVGAYLGYREEE